MRIIHHHKQGFTIIEVSLVLAIAGLIFAMIFIALPALQRQSRDTKRREDTLTLVSAIKKYQQNNRGQLPQDWDSFYANYLGDNFASPENQKYTILPISCSASPSGTCNGYDPNIAFENKSADWYIFTSATCQNDEPAKTSNTRNIAVIVQLESGKYCANT